MKRNTALNWTFSIGFDIDDRLAQQSLSRAHREPLSGVACVVLVAIGIALCIMPDAGGSKPMQYVSYKEYALHLLHYDVTQYKCLTKLYGKESAWNPRAKNGSHYGIPQGRSEWLKDQDGYAQVRWGLDYIAHRYGEPCIALAHWRAHNWH